MTSYPSEPYYGPSVVPENDVVNSGASESSSTPRNRIQDPKDEISAILEWEQAHYLPVYDYLAHNLAFPNSDAYVTDGNRQKMVSWAFEVADFHGFDREVVSIAMSYIDRMSSIKAKNSTVPLYSSYFRDIGIVSMYLACKLHGEVEDAAPDGSPRKLSISHFARLSHGAVTIEDIEDMESQILSTLDWHVNPPTMHRFIVVLLGFLPDSWGYDSADDSIAEQIWEAASFITDLIVFDPPFAFKFKASEMAYAAILCAMDTLQNKIPFPYEARLAFQDKVAEYTSMTPKSRNVRSICFTLKRKEEFPYKSENVNIPMPTGGLSRSNSSNGGTSSPVAVCEPLNGITNNHKIRDQKRTRLTYE